MTQYRLCDHRVCSCNDIEMQVCLSKLIEEYLDVLHWAVLTKGEDGGPGDPMSVNFAHNCIHAVTHAEPSIDQLERWCIANGFGGFLRLKR